MEISQQNTNSLPEGLGSGKRFSDTLLCSTRWIVLFYLKYFAFAALVLCVCVSILFPTSFTQNTFARQTFLVVILGLLTTIITRLLTDTICIYDAFAVSRYLAATQILLKVFVSLFVIAAYVEGHLNLLFFCVMQICMTGVIVFIMLLSIIKEKNNGIRPL